MGGCAKRSSPSSNPPLAGRYLTPWRNAMIDTDRVRQILALMHANDVCAADIVNACLDDVEKRLGVIRAELDKVQALLHGDAK